jgi:hypothetical protein
MIAQVGEFQSQGCFAKQSFGAFMEERASDFEARAEAPELSEEERGQLRGGAARVRSYLTAPEQPEDGAGTYNLRPHV